MAIPDRNLALELIRVTETAALAAAPWVGRGQKDLADKAAVEAMRKMINTVDMAGVVVIGEGEKITPPCFTTVRALEIKKDQRVMWQLTQSMEHH